MCWFTGGLCTDIKKLLAPVWLLTFNGISVEIQGRFSNQDYVNWVSHSAKLPFRSLCD